MSNLRFDEVLPDELAFVFDSWASSFKKSPWAGCVRNADYAAVMRATMSEIIDRGASVIVGWCPTEDGERRIVGYYVAEKSRPILHWLYVKNGFRGLGMGSELLTDLFTRMPGHTNWSYTFRTLASAGFLGTRFRHNPVHARVRYLDE